jgi:hypothetical protein
MADEEDRVGIISVACNFPGACVQDGDELESLWQVLNAKREELPFVPVPPERWTPPVKPKTQAASGKEDKGEKRAAPGKGEKGSASGKGDKGEKGASSEAAPEGEGENETPSEVSTRE